jgi:proteic killer suppression protein
VEIDSVRHKALRSFIETGNAKGIDARLIGRIRNIVAFLTAAAHIDELGTLPNFGFHPLVGNRAGSYAMTLTRNWRLTFTVTRNQSLADLDLEDHH